MLKHLLIAVAVATLGTAMAYSNQSTNTLVIPAHRTAPNNGQQMYASYCAPCHGTDGKGNGPAASALKARPTDLTCLRKNNHGKFPDTHIVSVLQFGAENQVHYRAEMPDWGPILGKMNQSNPQERLLRISNLSRYLDNLQVR